jgi:hypothetical protein
MFRKMNGCNAGEGERERNDTQVPGTVLSFVGRVMLLLSHESHKVEKRLRFRPQIFQFFRISTHITVSRNNTVKSSSQSQNPSD